MANYEVMRVVKIANRGGLRAALNHNLRVPGEKESSYPHALPEREHLNEYRTGKSADHAMALHREALEGLQKQKNSVVALEYVMTYSPESEVANTREKEYQFFKHCEDWLREKHGANNVLSVVVHRDEQTPHMHAIVIPVRERENQKPMLSARTFTDGRATLSKLQTEFHERVGKQVGLERGIEGSRAFHKEIAEWRREMRADWEKAGKILPKRNLEPPKAGEMLTEKGRQAWADRHHEWYAKMHDTVTRPIILQSREKDENLTHAKALQKQAEDGLAGWRMIAHQNMERIAKAKTLAEAKEIVKLELSRQLQNRWIDRDQAIKISPELVKEIDKDRAASEVQQKGLDKAKGREDDTWER